MAISLSSIVARAHEVQKAPRFLFYGVQGVGKTSLAAGAPSPLILPFEEGTASVPQSMTLRETIRDVDFLLDILGSLRTEDHPYQTLVFDTLDWLEPLIWRKTCERNNWRSIEDPGFGKGYIAALDLWREVLAAAELLREERGTLLVFLAHSQIKRFEDPTSDAYDRHEIKLQARASALVQEHCDCVFFLNYRTFTTKEKSGPRERTKAIGSGERVIYTEERPGWLAKSRLGHPPELDYPTPPEHGWPMIMNGIGARHTQLQAA